MASWIDKLIKCLMVCRVRCNCHSSCCKNCCDSDCFVLKDTQGLSRNPSTSQEVSNKAD
jgi:hypothetical protein